MNRLKDVPELARDGSNLSAVIASVREVIQTFRGYRGDPLDAAITRRTATAAGIFNPDGSLAVGQGSVGPQGPPGLPGGVYTPDTTPPPTPDGLAVSAGIGSIYIECNVPVYTQGHGHDLTVVYGAKWPVGDTEPTFSGAVELMRFQGTFTSYSSDPNTRWCIWIKWMSNDDVLSTSPAGGTNGVQATTGQDVSNLLEVLAGEITASQLHSALGTRIDLIDTPMTGLVAQYAALDGTVNSLTTGLSTKASVGYVDTAKADAISAAASSVATVQAQLDTGGATALAIAAAQSAADTAGTDAAAAQAAADAVSDALTNIASDSILSPSEKPAVVLDYTVITTEQAGIDAQATNYAVTTEKTAYDDAVTALTSYLGTLTGWNTVPGGDVVIVGSTFRNKFADVYTTRQALLDAIAAAAKVIADDAVTQAHTANTNAASAQTTADAAATTVGSFATSISNVQARLDSGDFAAVKTESSANASSVTGLLAQYTVKLDVNGKVSGYGLASTGPTGTGSAFEVRADKFVIAAETGSAAGAIPFTVLTVPVNIGGVDFSAGVYATKAFIQDAQISNAKIANLAVDNAKISSMGVSKLTAGSLSVGAYVRSTNYIAGYYGYGFSINGDGSAEFNNVTVRGEVIVGSSPALSGPGMSGYGTRIYGNGRFVMGTPSRNIGYDGSNLFINGFEATVGAVSGTLYIYSGGNTGYVSNYSANILYYTPIKRDTATLVTGYAAVTVAVSPGTEKYVQCVFRLTIGYYTTSQVVYAHAGYLGTTLYIPFCMQMWSQGPSNGTAHLVQLSLETSSNVVAISYVNMSYTCITREVLY